MAPSSGNNDRGMVKAVARQVLHPHVAIVLPSSGNQIVGGVFFAMKTRFPYVLATAIVLWSGGRSWLPAADAKLPRGGHTGAGQLMIISGDKEIRYRDNLGICHIRIEADGSLEAHFPGENQPTHLQIAETETRMVWKSIKGDKIFRATAIPFSAELYAFRLEILRDGKVIGGAQQFYALGRKSAVEPLSGAAPKR